MSRHKHPRVVAPESTIGITGKLVFLLAALILAGCSDSGTFKTRVIEFKCDGRYRNDWSCEARRVQGAELVYVGNAASGTVVMQVRNDPTDEWWAQFVVHERCAIVDADNWQCDLGGNIISVTDGKYSRYNHNHDFPIGYDVRGVTGWRYWLAKGLSLLGKKTSFLADK